MYPHSHFLLPFLIGEILVEYGIFTHELAIYAGLVGMLVDIDHFLYYAIKHKDYSLKNAWNAAVVIHEKGERTFIHHKNGFFILTVLFALLYAVNSTASLVLLIGYYTHILLDYAHLNVLNWKKSFKIEKDFVVNITAFELVLDVIMVLCILYL